VLRYLQDSVNSFRVDLLYDLANNVGYPALPMDVSKAEAILAAFEYQRATIHHLKLKLYYNTISHIMDDSHRDSLFYISDQSTGEKKAVYMRMDMPGKSSTLGGYLQEEFVLGKNRLMVKVDNYTNHSLAEMTMHMHYPGNPPEPPMYLQTWPDIVRNVAGLYVQNTSYISEAVTLNINGRIDYNLDLLQSDLARDQFSVFNTNISDNYHDLLKSIDLVMKFRFGRFFSIETEGGWSERMPVIGERFGFYLYNAYDGYDYIGNPNLKTEKSLFGKLGLTYSDNKLKIKVTNSYSFITDYIMGITNTNIPPMNFYTNGTRVYTNVPDAKLFSLDLQALLKPHENIAVFLLTKYTRGELMSGEPMPLIPPLKNILSVSYDRKNWSVQAENEMALKQDRINENYGETITPSWSIFNVKANYRHITKSGEFDFSAGVTNLTNLAYYEHLDWGKILRPGRSFNFFLKYSF
jgi:iron complex outermembrane receptor protein